MNYHDFFHNFTYYADREVGTVAYEGVLELFLDEKSAASGRFMDDAGFLKLWSGPRQFYLVVRREDIPDLRARRGLSTEYLQIYLSMCS